MDSVLDRPIPETNSGMPWTQADRASSIDIREMEIFSSVLFVEEIRSLSQNLRRSGISPPVRDFGSVSPGGPFRPKKKRASPEQGELPSNQPRQRYRERKRKIQDFSRLAREVRRKDTEGVFEYWKGKNRMRFYQFFFDCSRFGLIKNLKFKAEFNRKSIVSPIKTREYTEVEPNAKFILVHKVVLELICENDEKKKKLKRKSMRNFMRSSIDPGWREIRKRRDLLEIRSKYPKELEDLDSYYIFVPDE